MTHTKQLLKHPFSVIVSGPSKSGKTVFTTKLLEHIDSMSTHSPHEIVWYFSEYQPGYRQLACMPRVRLVQGLPDMKELRKDTTTPKLIVLDDLMSDVKKDQTTELFTKGVHHWNTSCIFIVQNLFFSGLRTARINTHYLALFKNPCDKLQVATLARPMYPKQSGVVCTGLSGAGYCSFGAFFQLRADCKPIWN